ncbi:MAG: hypothetical protein WC782_01855 [Methylococcaceae bacterium]|jgi:hypothetical protein
MSNEENTTKIEDTAKNKIGELVSKALALKESNPKLFFGVIGGLVLLIIIVMFSGGGSKPALPKMAMKSIVIGQKYVLKSANAYDENSTVRLVAVPGTIAAYDDTEEEERNSPCKHMPQGTPVTALETQDAYGKKDSQVRVQILEGQCKDQSGWVLAIDLQ